SKKDFSLNIEKIKNALNPKTCAIIVNSPNNPTGKIYSKDELQALVNVLIQHKAKCGRSVFIICDEPYRAITYGKEVCPIFPLYDDSIVVTSFAKNFSIPGERIGYIAINPKCKENDLFVKGASFVTRTLGFVNAPSFFQKVVSECWDAKVDYSCYEKNCMLLKNIMDENGLEYAEPEGAFYLFVKVPEKWQGDDMVFVEHLKKYNILAAPGKSFCGEGYVRFAYCVKESTITNSRNAFKNALSGDVL
ncbi:MAG: aminotransferase class I/II-fold pyridoxal phosphate-dependent enzyme, partial [Treponema sp.]|nr:aminotransferase class I/II-fold pyridoxal phosphate-dependent enzyme [Treponema sp.]